MSEIARTRSAEREPSADRRDYVRLPPELVERIVVVRSHETGHDRWGNDSSHLGIYENVSRSGIGVNLADGSDLHVGQEVIVALRGITVPCVVRHVTRGDSTLLVGLEWKEGPLNLDTFEQIIGS